MRILEGFGVKFLIFISLCMSAFYSVATFPFEIKKILAIIRTKISLTLILGTGLCCADEYVL